MLIIDHLEKNYSNFRLSIPGIQIKDKSITGFIGRNGAGKTTTIKCILGLTPFESGEIYLGELSLKKNEKKFKDAIGIVFDEGYFYDSLTIKETENIISAAYTEWDNHKFREFLSRYELSEKYIIKNLSKGMKMKLSFALAVSHNAQFLLLDEPSSGLDPEMRSFFREELVAQKSEGKTVFFSTHITSDLDRIADDIILLEKGKVLFQGSKETFLVNETGKVYRFIEDRMLSIIGRQK